MNKYDDAKYDDDDAIGTSQLVVQIWEVGISRLSESIFSGTIINS